MPTPSGMYVMPDGRSLASVIDTGTSYETERRGSNRRTGKGKKKHSSKGWDNGEANSAPAADAETPEVLRLGRDRRRRAMADKLLRDMAGNLTYSAIEALFKPAPFGETGHVSTWTEAAQPENIRIINHFLNIDMDEERLYLQKWEEHLRQAAQQSKAGARPSDELEELRPAFLALKAWSAVPRKARDALKRANLSVVDDLELPILGFLSKDVEERPSLEYRLADAFHRLLVHGLADFHGLLSHSTDEDEGIRLTTLRFPSSHPRSGPPEISCGDLLMALETAQPLTAESLSLCMAQYVPQPRSV